MDLNRSQTTLATSRHVGDRHGVSDVQIPLQPIGVLEDPLPVPPTQ